MLPWQLFGLTPRDASGTLIRLWNRYQTVSATSANLTVGFNVPADQAALLLHWSISCVAGAGAQPLIAELDVQANQTAAVSFFDTSPFPTGVALTAGTAINGLIGRQLNGIIAGPGSLITINASFTSGVPVNTMTASLGAFLIPRGDMAYV